MISELDYFFYTDNSNIQFDLIGAYQVTHGIWISSRADLINKIQSIPCAYVYDLFWQLLHMFFYDF